MGDLELSEVYTILAKHNYIVDIRRLEPDAIEVRWPVNRLVQREGEPLWAIYRLTEAGYFKESAAGDQYHPAPGYAIRAAILFDVFLTSVLHDLPVGLSRSADDRSLMEMLGAAADPAREVRLLDLVDEAKSVGFPAEFDRLAQEFDVFEGYQVIKELLP